MKIKQPKQNKKTDQAAEGVKPKGVNQEEVKQIDEISRLTADLLDIRYSSQGKKKLRGVHPKSHGCVKATFTINDDIDRSYREGLFSKPGATFQALIRFSNASAVVGDDLSGGQNGSRGMAIKVLNVTSPGPFIERDNGAKNQDFLMINTPAFAFANVPDYLRLTQVIHDNNDDPANFFAPLNPSVPGFTDEQRARTKQSLDIVTEIQSKPVANPLAVQYFGAAPFGFGRDRVMRFSVAPRGGEQEQIVSDNAAPNYLKDALITRMKQPTPVTFDFMVQVRDKNAANIELEDATTHWDESEFKFIKIASITIPAPQIDIDSPEHESACEKLVFTPWHALAAHEPLGGINRLRKKVYSTSAHSRAEDADKPLCPYIPK